MERGAHSSVSNNALSTASAGSLSSLTRRHDEDLTVSKCAHHRYHQPVMRCIYRCVEGTQASQAALAVENPPTSLVAQGKRLPAVREARARSLGREDPLEEEMAAHSSTLAWKIPWTEEHSRLQSTGSQRVGRD